MSPAKWFEPQSLRGHPGNPAFPLEIPQRMAGASPRHVPACSARRRRTGGLIGRRSVPLLTPTQAWLLTAVSLPPTPLRVPVPRTGISGPLPCLQVTSASSPSKRLHPQRHEPLRTDTSLAQSRWAGPGGGQRPTTTGLNQTWPVLLCLSSRRSEWFTPGELEQSAVSGSIFYSWIYF